MYTIGPINYGPPKQRYGVRGRGKKPRRYHIETIFKSSRSILFFIVVVEQAWTTVADLKSTTWRFRFVRRQLAAKAPRASPLIRQKRTKNERNTSAFSTPRLNIPKRDSFWLPFLLNDAPSLRTTAAAAAAAAVIVVAKVAAVMHERIGGTGPQLVDPGSWILAAACGYVAVFTARKIKDDRPPNY